ncbi:hypothetical protein [Psychrobacillus sp. FSL K6-1267]|uniref:hypothetical protein n=1 Tax=Psychrobacillus sp. FSL K6-1267 TaxID=2921543 RepID=UPI0030FB48CF
MAIIPLKQTIEVKRAPSVDDYGEPVNPTPFTLKCRFVEKSELIKKYSSGTGANQTMSAEVVANGQIFLNGYADILYTDTINYTDESGRTRTFSPLKIEPKRNFGGKAILTVVYV